jgi:hypothetical protein
VFTGLIAVGQIRRLRWSRSANHYDVRDDFLRGRVAAPRSVVPAVGMAVIVTPFAGRFADDLSCSLKQERCLTSASCRSSSRCLTGQPSLMARAP